MCHWYGVLWAMLALLAAAALAQGPGPAPAGPGAAAKAEPKAFIDYFLPTPTHGALAGDVWGAPDVGPRDIQNGLEDPTMKQYCYWDGQILKAPDGKYH